MNKIDNNIYKKIFDSDNCRGDINSYKINDVFVCTKTYDYPLIHFKKINSNYIINPIQEKIMSLSLLNNESFTVYEENNLNYNYNDPLFFFCFNFENYYHFIYDTLPYLISYFEIKKEIHSLKLLVPNIVFKKFVSEIFELLNITNEDLIILSKNTLYKELYFSDSYTHGENSNLPPHQKTKVIYDILIKKSIKIASNQILPKNFYISRRTETHKNLTNIGTDYTSKRKLSNENELVSFLEKQGFVEVFTENLTMFEKINLFYNAENIVGLIGGGIVNCIFCKDMCNLTIIESPTFLNVNERFIYSFDKTSSVVYNKSCHVDEGEWKKYQRVYIEQNNIFGEIISIDGEKLLVQYSNKLISGFNSETNYEKKWFESKLCKKLDNGLNSPFKINLEDFIKFYEKRNSQISPRVD
jgi:hypothetical protein